MRSPFKFELSQKIKIVAALLVLSASAGALVGAYYFYDFTQNNPRFCLSCHLMKPAFDAWAESEHKDINCHDCHHLSIAEQNKLLITFVVKQPEEVPPRHGEVIVPWKYCVSCHWETNERYPGAPKVNDSPLHAKHYYMAQIECSRCHGYIVHEFTPEERFCLDCHRGKTVHGGGMEELACLNCHTDKTPDLRPDREKCLFCHGGQEVRDRLLAEGTLDITHYLPSDETIKKATKINAPKDAPMQFKCHDCHMPHKEIRPDWKDCLNCHINVSNTGNHALHINTMGMSCKNCHKPHIWGVRPEDAKKLCTGCHEYRAPAGFLR